VNKFGHSNAHCCLNVRWSKMQKKTNHSWTMKYSKITIFRSSIGMIFFGSINSKIRPKDKSFRSDNILQKTTYFVNSNIMIIMNWHRLNDTMIIQSFRRNGKFWSVVWFKWFKLIDFIRFLHAKWKMKRRINLLQWILI
jgi:hypothetical protein